MSLLPVITARTSDALQNHRLIHQINADQTGLQRLFDQLSTGRRVISASDDPAAATRALAFQYGIAHSEQMVSNAEVTSGLLQSADTALASIGDTLLGARSVAVSAVQNTLSGDERETLTEEVDQAISRLVVLANQSFNGSYLFGGALTDRPPVEQSERGITFVGNEAVGRAGVTRDTSVETLPTGTSALGLARPAIQGSELSPALTGETRLVDMRGGRGIQPGVMRLSDGSGWVDVDLRGAVTLGDVAERIEAIEFDGRSVAVDIGADSLTVRFADGLNGTLGIDDAPGSITARDLNISNPDGLVAPPIVGGGLAPRATTQTPLAVLNDGAGIDLSAGLRIQQGTETIEVDLSSAETIDDVLAAINRSGASVRAEFDSTTESIQVRLLTSGIDYAIGENGGTAATALGLRSATGDVRLDSLEKGRGAVINDSPEPDLVIRRPDGTELGIDATGLSTVGDVIAAINAHPDNQDAQRVSASLATVGNGIRLTGPVDALPIQVRQPGNTTLGTALGLIPHGSDTSESQEVDGVATIAGADYATVEPKGALDTLVRLREAVRSGDVYEIQRLTERLDGDMDRATDTRGTLGYRAQSVDNLRYRAEDQAIAMRSRMSEEIDADVATTISDITLRQQSLEASMQLIGRTAGLTVLNFL